MKKTIFVIASSLVLFSLATSCKKKEQDTQKPTIKLESPKNGDFFLIGDKHGMHFDCELTDNVEVKNYRVEIHNNFDGHKHQSLRDAKAGKTPFAFDKAWEVNKRNTKIHHHEIKIPANAMPGEYHFVIYCLDVNKNESMLFRTIHLTDDPDKVNNGHHHDHDHGHDHDHEHEHNHEH